MDELTVIIDDEPATEEQRAELLKLYDKHGKNYSYSPPPAKIRHFTWHYARRRADDLNYV